MKNLVIAALVLINAVFVYLFLVAEQPSETASISDNKQSEQIIKNSAVSPTNTNVLVKPAAKESDIIVIDDSAEQTAKIAAKNSTELYNNGKKSQKEAICLTTNVNMQCVLNEEINITTTSLSEDSQFIKSSTSGQVLQTSDPDTLIERLRNESLDAVSFQMEQNITDAFNEVTIDVPGLTLNNSGCSEKLCFTVLNHNNNEDWLAFQNKLGDRLGTSSIITYQNADTGQYETRILSAPGTKGFQL